MNVDLAQELLNEFGASLEKLETQQTALLQFLKDKGIVTDDQLAPYLEQAGKVSDVRWRAARIRLAPLISKEKEREEQREKQSKEQPAEKEQPQANAPQAPSHDRGKQDQDKQDHDKQGQDKQDQGKEAKSSSGQGSGEAAPQRDQAMASATMEGAGVQSVAEKNGEQQKLDHQPG
jgi:hypothetical protein